MTDTPILDTLVADDRFQISEWLGTEFEPWPDPYVVLPPSPTEAQRLVAERAGWDTYELDQRAIRAQALADAERTMQLMAIEPEPDEEPEVVPVPPEVDEFLDNPDTGVTHKRKEKDNANE